ncbi:MAG: single-stranded DNA-binding protein [Actinobacteria bacterium]|jgi:single-stranded DNA-binding protein|nr:single-stranded DNA-binding protein [Actinomycetota bacterium]
MAIRTQQSVTGFIASDPQLTFTTHGDARLYAKIGQEHYRRNDDGSYTQLDTTFHDLVIYRRTAERAHAAFAKGDRFVAEGYVRTYEHQVDGQTCHGEEFIATKLGHDTARTTYSIDRTRRAAAVDQAAATEAPTRALPDSTPSPATSAHDSPAVSL